MVDLDLDGDLFSVEIKERHEAQEAMMRQPGKGRTLIDQLNAITLRALPQRITIDDLGNNYDPNRHGTLDSLPAFERRERVRERVRREMDEAAINFDGIYRNGGGSQREDFRDNI